VKELRAQAWRGDLLSVCAGALAAAASYWLARRFGPAGAAVATAVGLIILGVIAQRRILVRSREAESALRDSEQRLQLIINGSGVATWDSDLRTGKTYWNARAFELFGFEPTPDGSVTLEMWRSHTHPDDMEAVRRALERAHREHTNFAAEHRIVRAPDDVLWVKAFGRYDYDERGKAVRFAGLNLDITELKRAQEDLREADQRKDEFLAVLAHELRNPLAPLRDSLRLFERAAIVDPKLGTARQIMQRQIAQMVRLIDDLLDISRITRNKLELRKETTRVADALESALETCRPAITAAGHRLNVHMPSEALHAYADPIRLAQIFSNLLSNAVKYTQAGGEIMVTVAREQQQAVISISDSGVGIEPHNLSRIFEMFTQVRAEPERRLGGLGIGLALASQLVRLHGGTIVATSRGRGAGSTFAVRLPIVDPPQVLAPQPGARESSGAADRRRVLVTDDNEDAATALALLLTHMGNDVQIAHDGQEALDVAAEFRPDLILMDVGMPRLDGLEATRRLRTTEWGRRATIVALTGWGQETDRRRSHEAGADAHLVKPVDPEALEKVLAALPE
jgi:PAS domain S-box-containing protein